MVLITGIAESYTCNTQINTICKGCLSAPELVPLIKIQIIQIGFNENKLLILIFNTPTQLLKLKKGINKNGFRSANV